MAKRHSLYKNECTLGISKLGRPLGSSKVHYDGPASPSCAHSIHIALPLAVALVLCTANHPVSHGATNPRQCSGPSNQMGCNRTWNSRSGDSSEVAVIKSLPFVHTASRYYRLNDRVRPADWSALMMNPCISHLIGWKDRRARMSA